VQTCAYSPSRNRGRGCVRDTVFAAQTAKDGANEYVSQWNVVTGVMISREDPRVLARELARVLARGLKRARVFH
jgi:hypothetical protein